MANPVKSSDAKSVILPKQAGGLGGENARGEVAACPTGLGEADQTLITPQPSSGGTPATGAVSPSPPPAPGEGVSEQQVQQASRDKAGA